MNFYTYSEAETKEIGQKIARTLHGGDIVALHGDLGAGKTTFVKGLANGLGIKEDITSPTFTLMNVYELKAISYPPETPERSDGGRGKLKAFVHIDTYRLKNEQELIDIGVEDYLVEPDTVCIIEWPEKIAGLLKDKKIINISLEHGATSSERIITLGLKED